MTHLGSWSCPDCKHEHGRRRKSGSIKPATDGLIIAPLPGDRALVKCPSCGTVREVIGIEIVLMPARVSAEPATV